MRYIIILLILCSCSASWHLRRAIKKNPSIVDTTTQHVDSIFALVKDSSYVDSVANEATILISKELDSLSPVKKEAVKKVIKKAILDMPIGKLISQSSMKLLLKHGKVELSIIGNTIKATADVKHITVQDPKKDSHWYDNIWWILLIVFFILIVLKRLI